MLGSKGQLTPMNLVGLLIMIIILGTMLPVVYPFIVQGANATNSSVTQTLLYLLPAGLILGAFLVIFKYPQPYYQQPPV